MTAERERARINHERGAEWLMYRPERAPLNFPAIRKTVWKVTDER